MQQRASSRATANRVDVCLQLHDGGSLD